MSRAINLDDYRVLAIEALFAELKQHMRLRREIIKLDSVFHVLVSHEAVLRGFPGKLI
jgi:hypothetical protein